MKTLSEEENKLERDASHFARCLLIPANRIMRDYPKFCPDGIDLAGDTKFTALCNLYQVTEPCMMIRLFELNIIGSRSSNHAPQGTKSLENIDMWNFINQKGQPERGGEYYLAYLTNTGQKEVKKLWWDRRFWSGASGVQLVKIGYTPIAWQEIPEPVAPQFPEEP